MCERFDYEALVPPSTKQSHLLETEEDVLLEITRQNNDHASLSLLVGRLGALFEKVDKTSSLISLLEGANKMSEVRCSKSQ